MGYARQLDPPESTDFILDQPESLTDDSMRCCKADTCKSLGVTVSARPIKMPLLF